MKATRFDFDQIAYFRTLAEQKGVTPERLQEHYSLGALADVLEIPDPKKITPEMRDAARRAWGLPPLNPPLLEKIGTVTIVATSSPFVVSEKYVLNYGPEAKPGVRIAYISENFQSWFSGKFEESRLETALDYAKLARWALDKEVRKEIGAEYEETMLAGIHALLERQPNGEKGVLLNDGRANIFYVKDARGVLRVVLVSWNSVFGGWIVNAREVTRPLWWRDGNQVFSRNSFAAVAI